MINYFKWLFDNLKEYYWIAVIGIIFTGLYFYGLSKNIFLALTVLFLSIGFGISLVFYFGRKS